MILQTHAYLINRSDLILQTRIGMHIPAVPAIDQCKQCMPAYLVFSGHRSVHAIGTSIYVLPAISACMQRDQAPVQADRKRRDLILIQFHRSSISSPYISIYRDET
jgi:hypothetical protein